GSRYGCLWLPTPAGAKDTVRARANDLVAALLVVARRLEFGIVRRHAQAGAVAGAVPVIAVALAEVAEIRIRLGLAERGGGGVKVSLAALDEAVAGEGVERPLALGGFADLRRVEAVARKPQATGLGALLGNAAEEEHQALVAFQGHRVAVFAIAVPVDEVGHAGGSFCRVGPRSPRARPFRP